MDTFRNRSERSSTRKGQAVVVKPLKRQQPRSVGYVRSAGTGMYIHAPAIFVGALLSGVHEDPEHRTRSDHDRAVDY
jgi:hypothetical protein